MTFFEKIKNWFKSCWQKIKDSFQKATIEGQTVSEGSMFKIICIWVYKLRSVFLAIPVAFAAIIMAIQNMTRLPETVNLYFPGENILTANLTELSREAAVFGPLLVTVVCLVMMFLSRRVTFPWLISLFTLILPPFIYFITVFPG